MPRYVKYSEERWVHPHYRKAYVFRYRNGMAYTCVNSYRQATGYEFLPKNKRICMEILNRRLNDAFKLTSDKSNKSLYDLVKQFHNDKVKKLNIVTQKQYKKIYKEFLSKELYLNDINAVKMHIIEVKNSLRLANNTIWKRMQRLRKLFDYGVELDWIEKNPITKSMIPSYENKTVVVCSEEHINNLINYFMGRNNITMALSIEFIYLTGLRIQEMIDLQWEDLKSDYFIIHGKGSRDRVFPLKPFPRLLEIIDKLKILNPLKPFDWKNQQTPAKYLKKAVNSLGYSNITYHIIRKSAINRWRTLGIESEIRNLLAGHTKDVERSFYLTTPDVKFLEMKLSKI